MRGGTKHNGYTIVEVMVFMAVSGLMFVMAASFVSGKQARSEFKQGADDINSQMRSIINDASNGFFPSTNNFVCRPNSSHIPDFYPLGPTDTGEQGTNQGCTFLGKVVQFSPQERPDTGYNVFSVAGLQFVGGTSTGTVPSSFSDAKPVVVKNSYVDLTDRRSLKWGLKFVKATTVTPDVNGNRNLAGIGFFSSFNGYDPATSTLASGSQTTVVIPIFGNLNTNETAFLSSNMNDVRDSNVDAAPNILLCFQGGSGQYASLTIGGSNGQRLSTSLKVADDAATLGCD